MRCDNCLDYLKELSLHSTRIPVPGPRLAAHLAGCAPCRAAYREMVRLNQTACTLPAPASEVPTTLRRRVLDNLPAELPAGASRSAPPLVSRRLALGASVAAIAAGALLGPRVLMRNSFAADVQAAVRRAQTWHFVGWRLREGKKVRWEIWGQRQPYLYREQIGDELLLDDGKSRVRIVPPSRSRTKGMVLITASHPQTGERKFRPGEHPDVRTQYMEGISGDRAMAATLRQIGQEGALVTLEAQSRTGRVSETAILTVNKKSSLPVRYTLRRTLDRTSALNEYIASSADPKGSWMQAELAAEYDLPVPEMARRATPPSGYAVVDLTLPVADLHVPPVGSASKNGITLQAEVVERDTSGNLHLRFHGWLGNQPVKRGTNLQLALAVNYVGKLYHYSREQMNRVPRVASSLTDSITDERGIAYVRINEPPVTSYPDAPEMYLVPLEPAAAGQPLPRKLTLWVGAGATVMEWEEENRSYSSTSLVTDLLKIDLPLPTTTQKFDYDTVTSPRVQHIGLRPTLAMEAAAQRADYYERSIDARISTPAEKRHEIERALFWFNEAIRANEAIHQGEAIRGRQLYISNYRKAIARLNERLERLNKTGE